MKTLPKATEAYDPLSSDMLQQELNELDQMTIDSRSTVDTEAFHHLFADSNVENPPGESKTAVLGQPVNQRWPCSAFTTDKLHDAPPLNHEAPLDRGANVKLCTAITDTQVWADTFEQGYHGTGLLDRPEAVYSLTGELQHDEACPCFDGLLSI